MIIKARNNSVQQVQLVYQPISLYFARQENPILYPTPNMSGTLGLFQPQVWDLDLHPLDFYIEHSFHNFDYKAKPEILDKFYEGILSRRHVISITLRMQFYFITTIIILFYFIPDSLLFNVHFEILVFTLLFFVPIVQDNRVASNQSRSESSLEGFEYIPQYSFSNSPQSTLVIPLVIFLLLIDQTPFATVAVLLIIFSVIMQNQAISKLIANFDFPIRIKQADTTYDVIVSPSRLSYAAQYEYYGRSVLKLSTASIMKIYSEPDQNLFINRLFATYNLNINRKITKKIRPVSLLIIFPILLYLIFQWVYSPQLPANTIYILVIFALLLNEVVTILIGKIKAQFQMNDLFNNYKSVYEAKTIPIEELKKSISKSLIELDEKHKSVLSDRYYQYHFGQPTYEDLLKLTDRLNQILNS